jgi:hypothetical protein
VVVLNADAKRRSLSSISFLQVMETVRGSERARDQILRRSSLGRRGKRVNVVGSDIVAVRLICSLTRYFLDISVIP